MQKQYKLYKIDRDELDTTLGIISKYTYERISDCVVAISYDYMNNGYKELLEEMSGLSVSQYIFTTSKFYNLLTKLVKKDLELSDIKLNDLFEDDNNTILKYIMRLNQNNDKEKSLESLLNELRWYNYDEGIDIIHMAFIILCNEQRCKFHFYNNGVLAIDSDKIVQQVFMLLREIM